MPRVKRGVTARAAHKKVINAAKGFRGRRKNVFRIANEAVMRAGQYAYRDRRNKKRDFRALWITRINAAAREHGLRRVADGCPSGLPPKEQRDRQQPEHRDRHRRAEVRGRLAGAREALLEAQRRDHDPPLRSTVTRPELDRAWIENGAPASSVTPRICGVPPLPDVDASTR